MVTTGVLTKIIMLWAPHNPGWQVQFDDEAVHKVVEKLSVWQRQNLHVKYDPDNLETDDQMVARLMASLYAVSPAGEFHWYQLITHAFLHDTSSIYNFAMHLAGNMLFRTLAFGTARECAAG